MIATQFKEPLKYLLTIGSYVVYFYPHEDNFDGCGRHENARLLVDR